MSFRDRAPLDLLVLPLLLLVGGCGGGLSSANPNTQTGLGTLIVKVSGSGNEGAVVFLDDGPRPTQNGRAVFYNVSPGKHYVRALSQSSSSTFPASANVNIVADKTLTISLEIESPFPNTTPL